MRLFITSLACLISVSVFGQVWEQSYGGAENDSGKSVQQTTDGGYIIAGTTRSFGNGGGDVYLIKTDGNGVEQWSQTYGGTESDSGSSVQQTTDGGYIIAGYTASPGNGSGDVYLSKIDGNGLEQWNQTFGGNNYNEGYSVQQTSDGGYIIAGVHDVNGLEDVYLIKTDGNGTEQWSQTYGGTSEAYGQTAEEHGYSVQQTSDGGYIIAGVLNLVGGDVYLIKTDGNGVEQWSQTYGGTTNDESGYSVQQTTDGGYIIVGYTLSFGNGSHDVYLIKTDGNGVEQWSRTYGGTGDDNGYSVQQTTDGGYIIAGSTNYSTIGVADVYLIKTDGNGTEQWSQTYGGTGEEHGYSVQQTSDGGYIIAGYTSSSSGNGSRDVYLIKTDSEGTLSSSFTIPTPSNRKLEKVVDVLGREVNHTTNQILFHIYDDGSVEKKFVVD